MPCTVCVAADISAIKINLLLAFPYQPRLDGVVQAAEVAFTNYAQYGLGLPANRAAFTTLAVTVFDASSQSWLLIEANDYTSTMLVPGVQLYLFQPNVTEVPGEIPDAIDAQLFLTPLTPSPRARSTSAQVYSRVSEQVAATNPAPSVVHIHRQSRGTSTELDEVPTFLPPRTQAPVAVGVQTPQPELNRHALPVWTRDPALHFVAAASAPPVPPAPPLRETTREVPPLNPSSFASERPARSVSRSPVTSSQSRSPRWAPRTVPLVQPVRSPSSSSASARVRAPTHGRRSPRAVEVPRSWRSLSPTSAHLSSPSAPSAVARSPLPENRGKSILRDERDRQAHLDEVSLDHLRADLKREEQNFDVSLESRSVSQRSHR